MTYSYGVEGVLTPVLGFAQAFDHLGRVVTATGPAGTQRYTYGDRGRLSRGPRHRRGRVHDPGVRVCWGQQPDQPEDLQLRQRRWLPDQHGRIDGEGTLPETLNHYDSADYGPAWTQTKTRPDDDTAWTTVWDRYITDLSGGLSLDVDNTGKVMPRLANLNGDTVTYAVQYWGHCPPGQWLTCK
jgi:hypothetical protein